MTVSRVLRDSGQSGIASPETRQRVIEVANKLGYRRNRSASVMRTGQARAISLLIGTGPHSSHIDEPLIKGIAGRLREMGMRLVISRFSDRELSDPETMSSIFREQDADGLLIDYTHLVPERLPDLIQRFNLPTIWLNNKRGSNCVYHDDFRAGRDLTRHAISRHGKRIIYIDLSHAWDRLENAHYSASDRELGYCRAMEEAGAEAVVCRIPRDADMCLSSRVTYLQRWLRRYTPLDAVVMYSHGPHRPDVVAVAQATMGVTDPTSLPVYVCSNVEAVDSGGSLWPEMLIDNRTLGARAVDRLLELIARPDRPLPPLTVEPRLVGADKCGRIEPFSIGEDDGSITRT